jgi:hypothetical protein
VPAANISTLKKRRRAFVGKILMKRHAYEKLAPAFALVGKQDERGQKKSGAFAPLLRSP